MRRSNKRLYEYSRWENGPAKETRADESNNNEVSYLYLLRMFHGILSKRMMCEDIDLITDHRLKIQDPRSVTGYLCTYCIENKGLPLGQTLFMVAYDECWQKKQIIFNIKNKVNIIMSRCIMAKAFAHMCYICPHLFCTLIVYSWYFHSSAVFSHALSTPGRDIKIMTWNLLAPLYAPASKFRHSDPSILDWSYRKEIILDTLTESQADIICLQEVQMDLWDDFHSQLQHRLLGNYSYTAVLQNVTRQHPVGCVVLVKKDWKVIRTESRSRACIVVLEEQLLQPTSYSLISRICPSFSSPQGRERQRLYLATVHLEAGHDKSETRWNQLKSLLKRLHRQIHLDDDVEGKTNNGAPIIVAGDFNDLWQPNSELKEVLSIGKLDSGHHYNKLAPPPAWQSLLPLRNVHEGESRPDLTYAGGSVLDYIWVSPASFQVQQVFWGLPKPTALESSSSISFDHLDEAYKQVLHPPQAWPAKDFPSDHLPIGATLSLNKKS